jgi:transcription initiation factor TFIID TATA-box-binding protein
LSLDIVNIIASAKIKGSIDIELLFQKLLHADYNPEMFPGLIYRRQNRKPTMIMFASGKISSHGSKTEKEAKEAIVETLKEIEGLGCIDGSPIIKWIRIENVVGNANLLRKIDLEKIYELLQSSIYEPGQFPGIIFKPLNNSVTCLIFSSGKMVIVGGKSEDQVDEAFQLMKKVISEMIQ